MSTFRCHHFLWPISTNTKSPEVVLSLFPNRCMQIRSDGARRVLCHMHRLRVRVVSCQNLKEKSERCILCQTSMSKRHSCPGCERELPAYQMWFSFQFPRHPVCKYEAGVCVCARVCTCINASLRVPGLDGKGKASSLSASPWLHVCLFHLSHVWMVGLINGPTRRKWHHRVSLLSTCGRLGDEVM